MRYIHKPPAFSVDTHTFSFDDFVKSLVTGDDRFNSSGQGIRAGIRIEDALEKGDVLELGDDHWKLLQEAAEKPTGGYPTLISIDGRSRMSLARKCLPYVDAISAATNSPPKEEEHSKE